MLFIRNEIMSITASQVKELRQKTGVGMMECKKALVENGGDLEKSILWLRERGMSRAAKKAGRVAAEGMIAMALSADAKKAAILEVNCETDFSAKNESFVAFVKEAAQIALDNNVESIEQLAETKMANNTVGQQLVELVSTVGENMQLRRVKTVSVDNGLIASYSHMGGKIGCLVVLEGEPSDAAAELGKELAMHVAAAAPRFFDRESVDATELEQEKELSRKKLLEQGKPAEMIEKILVGQMNKFYSEICFVDQPFVKEPKLSITKYVAQTKLPVKVVGFERFQLGEGIEKKTENFADEVAAQLKK